jgi:chromatin modification-related protein YNG2
VEEGDEDAEGEDADGDDEKLYCFCQKHSYGDVSKT